jgi:hypothetical protein
MSGDEEIVGADHRAPPLEVGTDLRVVDCRVLIELLSVHVRQKGRQGRCVLRAPRGNLDAVQQLGLGDNLHADVADRHRLKPLQHERVRALHDGGTGVSVEP